MTSDITPKAQARRKIIAIALNRLILNVHAYADDAIINANEREVLALVDEALAAERQQQRAETVEIVMRILKRESECWPPFGSGGTARTILARVGEVIAALDAAVPGAQEVTDGE